MISQKSMLETGYEDLLEHFSEEDSKIFGVLERVGPVEIVLVSNFFQSLVTSVLSQQVSTKSADSTIRKVVEFMGSYNNPEEWMGIGPEKWREYGVSRQKSGYIQGLAEFFHNYKEDLKHFQDWNNKKIIDFLVQIKGIGEWTAQMFLIFSLGRPNVLAHGDLAIKSMTQKVYELKELPTKAELEKISTRWHPHLTWTQIYLWRYSGLVD
jgi:DNA-3-methyladenine glycosylase II